MQKIQQSLTEIQQYAEYLSMAATYEQENFINSPLIYGGAERFIILGMQQIVKVCKELVIMQEGIQVSDKTEMLTILQNNRVYPPWLYKNLSRKIRYADPNNYDYLKHMDKAEIYKMLEEIVSDLRHFRKYVLEYIV